MKYWIPCLTVNRHPHQEMQIVTWDRRKRYRLSTSFEAKQSCARESFVLHNLNGLVTVSMVSYLHVLLLLFKSRSPSWYYTGVISRLHFTSASTNHATWMSFNTTAKSLVPPKCALKRLGQAPKIRWLWNNWEAITSNPKWHVKEYL